MTEVFAITPAAPKTLWTVALILAVFAGLAGVFAFFLYTSQATRVEVGDAGLSIRRTLYGRTIPWSEIDTAAARVVDLRTDSDLQPVLRTNGIGLPGYQAGWFELREAGRALLFVTDPSRVVAVPVRAGYMLLVSVGDPAALVAALRGR